MSLKKEGPDYRTDAEHFIMEQTQQGENAAFNLSQLMSRAQDLASYEEAQTGIPAEESVQKHFDLLLNALKGKLNH